MDLVLKGQRPALNAAAAACARLQQWGRVLHQYSGRKAWEHYTESVYRSRALRTCKASSNGQSLECLV